MLPSTRPSQRTIACLWIAAFLLPWLCSSPTAVSAANACPQIDDSPIPPNQRAVDSLQLDGKLITGLILRRTDEAIFIAVDRGWLKQTFPQEFARFQNEEQVALQSVLQQYRDRFDAWIKRATNQEPLTKEIASERDRILEENSPEQLPNKRFIVLTANKAKVAQIRNQPLQRKRVAALAWKHKLDRVSERSWSDLTRALKEKGIDTRTAYFDLSADLPAVSLTQQQWDIRCALFEYDFTGELEFQGQGENLILTSGDVDSQQILAQMMAKSPANSLSRIGRELGLPEFQSAPRGRREQVKPKVRAAHQWINRLTNQADQKSARSVWVKRLVDTRDPDLVNLECLFIAKLSHSQWKIATRFLVTTRLSSQTPADLNEVQNDPRVQSAIKLVQQLGMGNGGTLEQAFRKGAATNQAITQANDQIQAIIAGNTSRLEAPWTMN